MISVGSLFSGGLDGIGLACEMAGMKVRWQIEKDDWRRQVLALRNPRSQIFGDITHVKAEQLRPVDVMVGGFPCQDISSAGRRAGIKGERSGLWYEFARLIRELRPAIILLENADEITAPIRERGTKRITDQAPGFAVLASLAEMGFDAQWGIVPASATGAPHKRDRWWCIGWNLSNANRIRQRRQARTAIAGTHDYHEQRDASLCERGRRSVVHPSISSSGDELSDAFGVGLQTSNSLSRRSETARSSLAGAGVDVSHAYINTLASKHPLNERTGQSVAAYADSTQLRYAERSRLSREAGQELEEPAQLASRSGWSDEPNVGGVVFARLSHRLERLASTQLWAAPLGIRPYPFEPPRLVDHTSDWANRVEAIGDSVCVPVAQAFAEGIKEAWYWLEAQSN